MAKNTYRRNLKRARKAERKLKPKKAQRTPEERAWDRSKAFKSISTYNPDTKFRSTADIVSFAVSGKRKKEFKDVGSRMVRDENKYYQLLNHWLKLKKQNNPESVI